MKLQKIFLICVSILIINFFSNALDINVFGTKAFAQSGNSITGHIFGVQRQPLSDVYVELLDDFSRTLQRTRTNGAGRYSFYSVSFGRFRVRVLPYGTDYEEQEQEIEIINFSRSQSGGVGGFSNEQRDFYLRPRKGANPELTGTIFAQEVPQEAKRLYEKAVTDLDNKKEKEGLQGLKSALEIFPKYYLALERLGIEYTRLGYFEAARILLSIAVDVNPRGYKSWYGLAYSLYSLKSLDEAAKAVEKAIELYPNSVEVLLLSGILMKQNNNFEQAEKQLLKAKDLANGTHPQIHWYLALLYGNDMKRYRDAAKELKLFLKAQPDTKDAEMIKKLIQDFEAKARKT